MLEEYEIVFIEHPAWYCYSIAPIDFGWGFCRSVEEVISMMRESASRHIEQSGDTSNYSNLTAFLHCWDRIRLDGIEQTGGHIPPHTAVIFPVMTNPAIYIGFALKFEGGTTLIYSPEPLDYLEESNNACDRTIRLKDF